MVKRPRWSYLSYEIRNAALSPIRFVLWLTCLFVITSGSAWAVDRHLVMAVIVNGRDIDQVADFVQRDTQLFAARRNLIAFGLLLPEASASGPDELVCLDTLAHVSYQIDESTQTLHITAERGAIAATLLSDGDQGDRSTAQASFGAVVNYDLVATQTQGQRSTGGVFDARVFNSYGVLDSSFLGLENPEGNSLIRLDSTYTYSSPNSMNRYRVGDVITGALAWTRPIRLGGFQMATDFSLRPDLITFPLPSFSSSTAVPSTVDVLVNGVQQLSHHVDSGPFDISQIPVVSGSGDVSVVVTDALGRQVVETLPFYASPSLLTPGLSSLSLELGKVRQNYGAQDSRYASLAAEVSYRRGILPWLTVETHGEGSASLGMGGVGAVVSVANFAVVSASVARSVAAGLAGSQYSVGVAHVNRIFSFSASTQIADMGFRDLASVNGDVPQRRLDRASLGVTAGRWGSMGLAYAGIRSADENVKLVSMSYSLRLFAGVSVFASAFHDLAQNAGTGVFFTVSMPFGARGSVSMGANVQNGRPLATMQASQSANSVGDIGWTAAGQGGQGEQSDHVFGNLAYRSSYGLFGAGLDRSGRTTTAQLTADGAFAFADGRPFATNTIQDSFAVVDTNGTPGISVMDENRFVARTGESGRVLIPDLRSYEANHVSIDPNDVPPDADVPLTATTVRPQDRSAVVVMFPIHRSGGAIVVLVTQRGQALALGSQVRVQGSNETGVVGHGGETFLRNLVARNQLTVTEPDGTLCSAVFDYKSVPGDLPRIGPLTCQ